MTRRDGRCFLLMMGVTALAAAGCAQDGGSAGATAEASRVVESVAVESLATVQKSVTAKVATAGPSALDHITAARSALAANDTLTATRELTEARGQLEELRSLNPSAAVQDSLREAQASLQAEGTEAAIARLEPVAQSLVVKDDYEDAVAEVKVESSHMRHVANRRAHEHITSAMGYMRQNDVERAEVELQSARETAVYSEVDLPVDAAHAEVNLALQAIEDGHPEIADEQLAAAQSQARTFVAAAQRSIQQLDVTTPEK